AGDGVRVVSQRVQHAGDRDQVVDVEAAKQRRMHAAALVAQDQVEGDALALHADVLRAYVALRATRTGTDGTHARRQRRQQLAAEGIGDVDHRRAEAVAREQSRLRRAVAGHAAVGGAAGAGAGGAPGDAT